MICVVVIPPVLVAPGLVVAVGPGAATLDEAAGLGPELGLTAVVGAGALGVGDAPAADGVKPSVLVSPGTTAVELAATTIAPTVSALPVARSAR
jgi:hypothetical protein